MLVVGFLWELAQLVELCTVNAMVVGSCPTLPAMTTKQLGNIGEAKALSKFVELQVPVYQAFGDNEKSDLIADFNGKLQRIQVKTSEKCEDGKITFSLVSSTMHRKNGVRHKYTKEEVDYFALYNLATNILLLNWYQVELLYLLEQMDRKHIINTTTLTGEILSLVV